jgi:hypothetical protein
MLQMRAKMMRSFAAGLIVAASICGAVYFSNPSEVGSTEGTSQPTEEQMKSALNSAGYVILTEKEWKDKLTAAEKKQGSSPNETGVEDSGEIKEKIIYRTVLNVASGMTSIDVGHALVKGKIIDDAKNFFNEVENRGLANELRPGTFELDSEMTMDEVISIIFK